MAFNKYITLDGKKYTTLQRSWSELPFVPMTSRVLLSGDLDATFGPSSLTEWSGEIVAKVTPEAGYGSPTDLYATLKKTSAVNFTDHRGTNYTGVHVDPQKMRSLLPDWEAASNEIYITVKILGKPA